MSRAPRRRVASSHIAIRLCPLADPMCVSPPCTGRAVASLVRTSLCACAHLPARCACPHLPAPT
eukprot:1734122-Prymnesium_polylepis.1